MRAYKINKIITWRGSQERSRKPLNLWLHSIAGLSWVDTRSLLLTCRMPKRRSMFGSIGINRPFPQVYKSNVNTPCVGLKTFDKHYKGKTTEQYYIKDAVIVRTHHVWSDMWLSSKTPTHETPIGTNEWQWYERSVSFESLMSLTIASI
jgi:hypothetical protein